MTCLSIVATPGTCAEVVVKNPIVGSDAAAGAASDAADPGTHLVIDYEIYDQRLSDSDLLISAIETHAAKLAIREICDPIPSFSGFRHLYQWLGRNRRLPGWGQGVSQGNACAPGPTMAWTRRPGALLPAMPNGNASILSFQVGGTCSGSQSTISVPQVLTGDTAELRCSRPHRVGRAPNRKVRES